MAELKTLNLAGAATFENIPTGNYDAVITKVEDVETENDTGNLPVGTPGINVTFRIDGGEQDGRQQWNRYWFAPDDYNPEKKKWMDGAWLSLLTACGFGDEKSLRAGKGLPKNTDELQGKEVHIRVGTQKNDPERNEIKWVKPRGVSAATSGLL